MENEQPLAAGERRPSGSTASPPPVGKLLMGMVGLVAVGALVVWFVGRTPTGDDPIAEVPLVMADQSPTKRQPEEPGGVAIPNQDKLVYGILNPDDQGEVVERLLPPPEEPVVVAPLPESAPEPTVESVLAAAEAEALAEIAPAAAEPAADAEPTVPIPSEPGTIAEEAQPSATFAEAEAAVAALEQTAAVAAPEQTSAVAAPEQTSAAAGAWRIQVGAFKLRKQAEQEWTRVVKKAGPLLAGMQPKIESVDLGVDQGIYHRLQVRAFADKAAAAAMCGKLSALGVGCLVVKP